MVPPLISRKRNNIELTDDGEEFGEAVCQALQIIDEHVEAIKDRANERNSEIKLGIVFSAQSPAWSGIMQQFWVETREMPRFSIRQGTTPELLHDLKNGDIDLVIAGTMGEDSSIVRIPCWSQKVVAVTDPTCPLAVQKAQTGIVMDDLRGYRVITYSLDGPLGSEIKTLTQNHNLNIEHSYFDEITLCSLVSVRPNTVALACKSWLLDSFKDAALLEVLDAPEDFHRFYMSYRSSLPKRPSLLWDFIDFMANYDFDSIACD